MSNKSISEVKFPPVPVNFAAPLKMPPIPFGGNQGAEEKETKPHSEYEDNGRPWLLEKGEFESRFQPKRKSRWAEEPDKSFTAQSFSFIPINKLSLNEIEILIRKHRIDDLSRRLIL